MKFSDLKREIIGQKVKLISTQHSNKGVAEELIKKHHESNSELKILDIKKDWEAINTVKLIDNDKRVFWVSHKDIRLIDCQTRK